MICCNCLKNGKRNTHYCPCLSGKTFRKNRNSDESLQLVKTDINYSLSCFKNLGRRFTWKRTFSQSHEGCDIMRNQHIWKSISRLDRLWLSCLRCRVRKVLLHPLNNCQSEWNESSDRKPASTQACIASRQHIKKFTSTKRNNSGGPAPSKKYIILNLTLEPFLNFLFISFSLQFSWNCSNQSVF